MIESNTQVKKQTLLHVLNQIHLTKRLTIINIFDFFGKMDTFLML